MTHPIEKAEALLFEVLGHVQDPNASDTLQKAIKCLGAIKDERNEHNNLIRTCSPLIMEEDGSDLIPNWCRVQNALMRLVSERNEYRRELNRMIDAYRGQVTRFGTYGDEIDAAIATLAKYTQE
jgi:Mg2+ and Co2+ transporter CorA